MTISLLVKPGRTVDLFTVDAAGLLTVRIKAPAQDGRANTYLMALLARELAIPKSAVTITAGLTSPHKRLTIDVSADVYERFLARIQGGGTGPALNNTSLQGGVGMLLPVALAKLICSCLNATS